MFPWLTVNSSEIWIIAVHEVKEIPSAFELWQAPGGQDGSTGLS